MTRNPPREKPEILRRIVESKRRELTGLKRLVPEGEVRRAASAAPPARDFAGALRGEPGHPVRLIAEFKRASPSKGPIRSDLAPEHVARLYQEGGAAAMSVLTDTPFFSGSLDDLRAVRSAIALPILRKDFTLEPYHVYEARAAGADAVLLIAAILSDRELRDLRLLAEELGMGALVEVHSEEELERAIASEARMIGVNNRDLRSFDVEFETTVHLKRCMPAGVISVSESGIATRDHVNRLREAGVDAMLVGESLMRQDDPAEACRSLLGNASA